MRANVLGFGTQSMKQVDVWAPLKPHYPLCTAGSDVGPKSL